MENASESIFYIATQAEFDEMDDDEVQAILRNHHIVITGRDRPKFGFDKKGLSSLGFLSKAVTVQGQLYYDICDGC
jgi:hypothetical protein